MTDVYEGRWEQLTRSLAHAEASMAGANHRLIETEAALCKCEELVMRLTKELKEQNEYIAHMKRIEGDAVTETWAVAEKYRVRAIEAEVALLKDEEKDASKERSS